MKTWIKYLITFLVLTLGATLFYFKVYVPKTTFKTLSAKKDSLSAKVHGVGNVDARDIYTINAQTNGRITNIFTDEGLWVKKGELLVEIDPVDLPKLLEEAKASLQKAEYELLALKQEMQNLKAQKTLIKISYERYEKLYKQKYAAKAEYDKALADLQSIDAQIGASKARINSSKAETLRAQKSIEAIKIKLSRLKLYAPTDGYVISKDVQASQTVLSAQSILKIVDTKTVWIKAYIDEQISSKIKLGQKVDITLRSQSEKIFTGTLERISAISDAVTQEREIAVSFDNLPIPFYINEQAEVSITTETFADIWSIDASLVSQENGKVGVWVAKDSRAYFQELEIVARSQDSVGVKSGVDENTKIIVLSPNKKPLSNGMRIH